MKHFSIPLKGLKNGLHQFEFEVDNTFFDHYENDLVKEGAFDIQLYFDKSDNVSTLTFIFDGEVNTVCDRCTAAIMLPIQETHSILLKLGEERDSTDEVMYISPETSILSLADLIYEYIILSIPIMKVYDCENDEPLPCNIKVLDKLQSDENKDAGSSIWENLKGLDLNN